MEPNVDIKRLPPAQEKIKENQRNKPHVNGVKAKTFKLSTFDTGQICMRWRVSLDAESHQEDEKESRET